MQEADILINERLQRVRLKVNIAIHIVRIRVIRYRGAVDVIVRARIDSIFKWQTPG